MAALSAALALLAACGGCESYGGQCTLIDSPAGIGVEVAPNLAPKVAGGTLTACWDGTCREPALRFRGTAREGSGPPGNPVVTAGAADAPGRGFAEVPRLQEKPTRITLTLEDQRGALLLDRQITVTPEPTYPNGRSCSPAGPQAVLIVTERGSLTER